MLKTVCPIALALLLSAISHPALSQCIKDPRQVALENGSIQVRAYACRDGGIGVRAEFYRFSADTAGLLTSGGSSEVLSEAIGSPRIFRNEVVAVLDDILDRFGNKHETEHIEPSMNIVAPGGGYAFERDTATGVSVVRQLKGGNDYPAVDEMIALAKGTVPPTLSPSPASDFSGSGSLWRFITLADLKNYENSRAEYNRIFAPQRYRMSLVPNPTIELMAYLAEQDGLPHEFALIRGIQISESLADESGGCMPAGWSFFVIGRELIMDAIILENSSGAPFTVGALRGTSSTGGLRRPPGTGDDSTNVLDLDARLAPGERILVPTRIVFGPSDEMRPYSTTSYIYGPAFDLTGLVVDDRMIDLEERSANFIQISLFDEMGSCPYLLSWKDDSRDWMQRGKILHSAQGAENEYREVIGYEGFRSRFRLEEREPEIAYIDEARLVITLDDGSKRGLAPSEKALVDRDGVPVALVWGEAVDFSFALPPDIEESQVDRSELYVTGYYERYPAVPVMSRRPAAVPLSVGSRPLDQPSAPLCRPGIGGTSRLDGLPLGPALSRTR